MLTGKQKRYLRSIAHDLKPIYQVGKDGVHEQLVTGVNKAIVAHELIKVKILDNCTMSKNEVAIALASNTIGEVVQVVGKTVLLYKENRNKENGIKLP